MKVFKLCFAIWKTNNTALSIIIFNMMCFAEFLFAVLAIGSSVWPFTVQAEMLADCTFGMVNATSDPQGTGMSATFISKLASYQNLSHTCVVKVQEQNHFLHVKAKRNKKSKGFLHMTVYGVTNEDESHLLGNLDVSKSESDWSTLILCPPLVGSEIQNRKLTFSGTPRLGFTAQIESSPSVINLNTPEKAEISKLDPLRVFQFIPPEDISKTQLDVTVISDSDVPAYLKVSRICKDVNENIRLVDYKGESIRLSFAKKGRITLSKVSVPPLTDSTSSWFIGIALKNATGKTASDARKTVTLTLKKSFDYSYGFPVILLVVITFFSGVIVSVWAFFCFDQLFALKGCSGCSCANWCTVVSFHWFTGPKTYSYITGIVGFVLMVGASQFVFANWNVMIDEGDRDNCYYNDFCYRVSAFHDIPFNSMISNLTYILHGLILAACVCCMEAKHLADGEEFKEQLSFSIGYAFAWALIFEGCFSLIYHLCPSKMTFQFDTAFMFVIAGFTVILLYNGIRKNEIPPNNAKGPVGAANFFLYFLAPLFIFNYLGALHHFEMHHSETGMSKSFEVPLFVCLVIWWVIIAFWAGYKMSTELCSERRSCTDKFCHAGRLCFAFCAAAPVLIFVVTRNLPETFLYSCIAESVVAIVFPLLVKACKRDNIKQHCADIKQHCENNGCCSKACCNEACCKIVFRSLYVTVLVGVWVAALYYFKGKPTTNKVESPEISRDLNEECEIRTFFDFHDIWHVLSSHALLMGAYLVMFISYERPTQGEAQEGYSIIGESVPAARRAGEARPLLPVMNT